MLVVAKGYKRKKLNKIDVVSNGEKLLLDCSFAGDEPYMIARNVPKAKVVVGTDKIKAIKYGVETFKPEVVLLDDGFQKRHNLKASANVVLINALNPFGYGYLFPAGLLREKVSALAEADVVVLTNVNLMSDPSKLKRIKDIILTHNKNIKIFHATHEPKEVYNINTSEKHAPAFLKNKKVIAFSSIGNPAGFEKTLKQLGARILFGFYYGDHHAFKKKELEGIAQVYKKSSADFVITTEKDEVRIKMEFLATAPVYALKIGMVIPQFADLDKVLKV